VSLLRCDIAHTRAGNGQKGGGAPGRQQVSRGGAGGQGKRSKRDTHEEMRSLMGGETVGDRGVV